MLIILRQSTKDANFRLGVQYPLKEKSLTERVHKILITAAFTILCEWYLWFSFFLTSIPNSTIAFTFCILCSSCSTSGTIIENLVFTNGPLAWLMSNSLTVFPKPLGYYRNKQTNKKKSTNIFHEFVCVWYYIWKLELTFCTLLFTIPMFRQKKKRFVSYIPTCISMWTHVCPIPLCLELI